MKPNRARSSLPRTYACGIEDENEWKKKEEGLVKKSIESRLTRDDQEEIERMASDLGVEPSDVRQTIEFARGVHDAIQSDDLRVHQAVIALMTVVSDLLRDQLPVMQRAQLVTELHRTLWESCGLSTDGAVEQPIHTSTASGLVH